MPFHDVAHRALVINFSQFSIIVQIIARIADCYPASKDKTDGCICSARRRNERE